MNKKEAEETIESGKHANIPTSKLEYCHGYLEAIAKGEKLAEALKKAKQLTMGPSLELQDSIMCDILNVLREWEKDR